MKRKQNRALIVGNGVHRLGDDEANSWGGVLQGLMKFANLKPDKRIDEKPFPILFEAILAEMIRNKPDVREIDLKRTVASKIRGLQPNKFHEKLVRLPVSQILTTNYDYCLEASFGDSIIKERVSTKTERKFSVYRCHAIENCRLWHIHGEVGVPNTIMLGHDHYTGYHNKIREVLIHNSEDDDEHYSVLLDKSEHRLIWDHWMHVFLTHDTDIIGFGFDFSESILWWMIQFRHKLIEVKGLKAGKLRFHAMRGPNRKTFPKRELARQELLRSFGVEIVDYKMEPYKKSYDTFIRNF